MTSASRRRPRPGAQPAPTSRYARPSGFSRSNPIQRAKQIRIALELLSEENGHHAFEQICYHLARHCLAPNIRFATGPVSAGGDQGRDGEAYWTLLPDGQTADSPATASVAHDGLVLACTIQKKDISRKIKRDVESICTEGRPTKRIVYFSVGGVNTATVHELQEWAEATHGVDLQMWDGPNIAHHLADQKLAFVVESCLHLPPEPTTEPSQLVSARTPSRQLSTTTLATFAGLACLLYALLADGPTRPRSLVYEQRNVTVVAGQCDADRIGGNVAPRSVVDLDRLNSIIVAGSSGVGTSSRTRDVAYYVDCPSQRARMMFYLGMATVGSESPTAQECAEAVPTPDEKVIEPRPGMRLCALTNKNALSLIEVRSATLDENSSALTVTLAVTLWR